MASVVLIRTVLVALGTPTGIHMEGEVKEHGSGGGHAVALRTNEKGPCAVAREIERRRRRRKGYMVGGGRATLFLFLSCFCLCENPVIK